MALFDRVFDEDDRSLPGIVWRNIGALNYNGGITLARASRRHEVGHLFGLVHAAGGVMRKPKGKRYGSQSYFPQRWCRTIARYFATGTKGR